MLTTIKQQRLECEQLLSHPYIRRESRYDISLLLQNPQIKLITGPRRAGKSILNVNSPHWWNMLWSYPEMRQCWDEIVKREKEKQAEQERKEREKTERYNAILDSVIEDGRKAQREFAQSKRICHFNDEEARRVYYALVALATKHDLSLQTKTGIENIVKRFLDGCDWYYISDFSKHCCYSWTNLFATKNANFDQSYIDSFLSLVDEMSGSAENNVSLSGSNGSADQLTNWDGTKKLGLAAPKKKKDGKGFGY